MKSYIIGITGGSGSGKTLFIKNVMEGFHADEVCFISQDNYYLPREEQPLDEKGIKNFDMPESIDLKKFIDDIKILIQGKEINIKEYTFNNPDLKAKEIKFKPAPVIILEGIFIYHVEEIRNMIDLKVFIDAREHLMLKRRIIRDEEERGYDLADVLYRYENHVMPAFNTYILPYKDYCDIIINNHSNFEESIKVMRSYINSILEGN